MGLGARETGSQGGKSMSTAQGLLQVSQSVRLGFLGHISPFYLWGTWGRRRVLAKVTLGWRLLYSKVQVLIHDTFCLHGTQCSPQLCGDQRSEINPSCESCSVSTRETDVWVTAQCMVDAVIGERGASSRAAWGWDSSGLGCVCGGGSRVATQRGYSLSKGGKRSLPLEWLEWPLPGDPQGLVPSHAGVWTWLWSIGKATGEVSEGVSLNKGALQKDAVCNFLEVFAIFEGALKLPDYRTTGFQRNISK